MKYQEKNPLTKFGKENPLQVAGNHDLQNAAADAVRGPLKTDRDIQAEKMNQSIWGQTGTTFGGADSLVKQADQLMRVNPQAGQVDSSLNYARQLAARRPEIDANSIANDAALQASRGAFEKTAMPMIGNQMAAMGLSDSGQHGQVLGDAWMREATPHVMQAQQREVDRLNRMHEGQQQEASQRLALGQYISDRQFQGLDAKQAGLGLQNQTNQLRLGLADQFAGMGQNEWERKQQSIDNAMKIGTELRGNEQAGYDAAYQDFLRRQGLSEKSLYAPFGNIDDLNTRVTRGGGK
jgi:hypothetical protein